MVQINGSTVGCFQGWQISIQGSPRIVENTVSAETHPYVAGQQGYIGLDRKAASGHNMAQA